MLVTEPNPTHFNYVQTQPNPTQPNPWMNPTHGHVCVVLSTSKGWNCLLTAYKTSVL